MPATPTLPASVQVKLRGIAHRLRLVADDVEQSREMDLAIDIDILAAELDRVAKGAA